MIRALVTERVIAEHRDRFDLFDRETGGVEWVVLANDADPGDADTGPGIDVGFVSSDLFFAGPMAAFVDFCVTSERLAWVQSAAAGTGIPIARTVLEQGARFTKCHVTAPAIGEFVIRVALDHLQQPERWRTAAEEQRWAHHDWRELSTTTWLIVGAGAIGCAVARLAGACGAHVIGVRRNPSGEEPVDEMASPTEVHGLLGRADIVVISALATPETAGLVDDEFCGAMREGSLLVNVARGSLIDDAALLRALDRGRPARAALDVFGAEPLPPDHGYWRHPSVTVTPHASGAGTARWARSVDVFLDNLVRFMNQDELRHEVRLSDLEVA